MPVILTVQYLGNIITSRAASGRAQPMTRGTGEVRDASHHPCHLEPQPTCLETRASISAVGTNILK